MRMPRAGGPRRAPERSARAGVSGRDAEPPEEPGHSRLESFLRPFVSDSTLWPVLAVVLAVFATFFAGALLAALRTRSLFAAAALLALAWLTAAPLARDLRARRLSAAGGLLLALWLMAVGIAFLGARSGFL